jgi:hypothetical protein
VIRGFWRTADAVVKQQADKKHAAQIEMLLKKLRSL